MGFLRPRGSEGTGERKRGLRIFLSLFSILTLVGGFFSPRNCYGQVIPFGAGEDFQYQIKWNLFRGGRLSFSVADDVYIDGERAFHLIAETETEGIFRRFYPYKAKVESFPSKHDFFPLRYHFSSWSPEETILEVVKYHRGQRKGNWVQEKYEDGKKRVKEEEFSVAEYLQDPLSIIYYLRTQDFEVGDNIEVPLSVDRKECRIMVKVLRKSKIRIMGETRDAFILEPGLFIKGVPFQRGSLWIWFSADEERIPLYFTARAALGVVSATLIKIKRPSEKKG